MNMKLKPIPLDIQLEAACSLTLWKMDELLETYGFHWDPQASSPRLPDYQYLFTFSTDDLLAYLCQRSEKCEGLLRHSYDQRCSPATFLEEWRGKYRVGWYDGEAREVQVFDRFDEAATDYVLVSFGFPRFRSKGSVG